MPPDELHKKKRKKNLMILALIIAWCALIWGVTMIKIAHAADDNADPRYKTQRANHQAEMNHQAEYYRNRAKKHAKEMVEESTDVTTRAAEKIGDEAPEGFILPVKNKKLKVK